MNATNRWLNAAKALHGFVSDYRLTKVLQVSGQRISNYRSERSQMDDELAIKVAGLAGVFPGVVLCELYADRAETPLVRKVWKESAQRLRESANLALPSPAESQ